MLKEQILKLPFEELDIQLNLGIESALKYIALMVVFHYKKFFPLSKVRRRNRDEDEVLKDSRFFFTILTIL